MTAAAVGKLTSRRAWVPGAAGHLMCRASAADVVSVEDQELPRIIKACRTSRHERAYIVPYLWWLDTKESEMEARGEGL